MNKVLFLLKKKNYHYYYYYYFRKFPLTTLSLPVKNVNEMSILDPFPVTGRSLWFVLVHF